MPDASLIRLLLILAVFVVCLVVLFSKHHNVGMRSKMEKLAFSVRCDDKELEMAMRDAIERLGGSVGYVPGKRYVQLSISAQSPQPNNTAVETVVSPQEEVEVIVEYVFERREKGKVTGTTKKGMLSSSCERILSDVCVQVLA